MDMSKIPIDILSYEQIFGEDALEIFKKLGGQCIATDFAMYSGGDVFYSKNIDPLTRTASYYTKTPCEGKVITVASDGHEQLIKCVNTHVGCRPVIPYEFIKDYATSPVINEDGVKEIEYGEYPQDIVDAELAYELEKEYNDRNPFEHWKNMEMEDKCFTVVFDNTNDFDNDKHGHYNVLTYKNNRYIRIDQKHNSFLDSYDNKERKNVKLSNGIRVGDTDAIWIKVEPIKWILDEKSGLAVSKSVLFGGVSLYNQKSSRIFPFISDKYKYPFEDTWLNNFLKNDFAKEIVNSKDIERYRENEINDDPEEMSNVISTIDFQIARLKKEVERINSIEPKTMETVSLREEVKAKISELENVRKQISVKLMMLQAVNGQKLLTDNTMEEESKRAM